MAFIKGPKFRPAKINPDRELSFKAGRKLPYRKRGVIFRKKGIQFRKKGIAFGNDGVSNIDIDKGEEPTKLNNTGIRYYNKGKYDAALKYFDKALAIAPSFNEARKNRVYCIKMINAQKERKHQLQSQAMLRERELDVYGRERVVSPAPPPPPPRPPQQRIPVYRQKAVVVRPIDHSKSSMKDFEQPYGSDYSRPRGKRRVKYGTAKWSGPARRSF